MKVRFFLRHGAVVDWPVPAGTEFSFPSMCKTIRSDGYFLTTDLYIPHSDIAVIGLENGPAPGVVLPDHATKQ